MGLHFTIILLASCKMGQTMGRMPETWEGLLEERDRVLHWSSEVLARVQDNVTNEDTFLIDYDDNKIDVKLDTWIKTNRTRVDEMFNKFPNASDQLRNTVNTGIEKNLMDMATTAKLDRFSDVMFSLLKNCGQKRKRIIRARTVTLRSSTRKWINWARMNERYTLKYKVWRRNARATRRNFKRNLDRCAQKCSTICGPARK
ncbi:PREDICTED: uncharacterized protein LOC105453584 isoform X3 [Wasmannia auropunctata]|uniref:uncharacterized protein LOC105453584 isoform X3 n=1 Tax=Wasmannia auropunctata TaxID=64793 RepID=UPI0005EF7B8C|nr:PREDICTED: uncharacterized protein LOC105453584 isoform X3 [Wasmannia auropunctata]